MTVLKLPNGIENKQRPLRDDDKIRGILSTLNNNLDGAIIKRNAKEPYGLHKLGVGSIGKDCERQLWYDFRKVKTPEVLPVNVYEIFETGNIYEERAIKLFEDAGQEVYYIDPETRESLYYIEGENKYVVFKEGDRLAHTETIARGLNVSGDKKHELLALEQGLEPKYNGKQFKSSQEIAHLSGRVDMFWKVPNFHNFVIALDPKSFNAKGFKQFVDKGVRVAEHKYYVQASKYAKDYGLNYAGIVGFCKDNDKRHIEIWHVDPDYITSIELKAKRIIEAKEAPQRIANNSAAFKCKFCDYNKDGFRLCHEGEGNIAINCRSCLHATATDNGKWFCEHKDVNAQIPDDFIMTGCQAHDKIV